jgi:hypothetical protein
MSIALLLVIVIAPFALAAAGLWLFERRKVAGGDVFADTFNFLVRDFGFSGPVVRTWAYERDYIYVKEAAEVRVFTDNAASPVLSISVFGHNIFIADFERTFFNSAPTGRSYREQLEAAAAFIKAHPEVLKGDFSSLETLNS